MKLFGNSKPSKKQTKSRSVPSYAYPAYDDTYQREEPVETQPRKKRRGRTALVVLCTLLVVCLGVAVLLKMYIRPPEKPGTSTVSPDQGQQNVVIDSGDEPDMVHDNSMREDFYTIMLVGTDEDDYNADVIMIAGIDVKNKRVDVVSIPRDTMLNVSRSNKKINCSYGVGKSQTGERTDGLINLRENVATIVGFEPDFYCHTTYDGFVQAVDAVGGIEYDVPQDIQKLDTTPPIDLKKGLQVLDGEHALMLMRYRGYENNDLGRIEAAHGFMHAVLSQFLSVDSLWNLPELAGIAMENCTSDLDLGEMTWFGTQLLGIDSEDINFYTIPVDSGMYRGASYVYADEEGTLDLINDTINPYIRDITASDVDIIRLED